MARITIQDCLSNSKITNHFELSVLASNRAKDIMSGAPLTLETNNDKATVLALREIANGTIDCDVLRKKLYNKFQMVSLLDINIEENQESSLSEELLTKSLQSGSQMLEDDNFDDLEDSLDQGESEDTAPAYSYDEENFDDNIDDSVNDQNFTRRPF